ncbi:TRAP transporter small permease [Patulibacter sp.]|uniref:TRAP transporter small permease n=1 Tax=Patulibacter sp. TaxID=1912859 RepID=UPI002721B645|nr:TRAP transporter small permease [Patulibacter sp.]MDO9407699.1 TRAP transporter small permease [Patulibacter sp.]
MERVRTLVRGLSGALAALAACALIILMAITVADVVRRAITDKSIEGAVEVAPLLLLGAVVLGLGYAEQTLTHVRTSLVTSRLPLRPRLAVRALGGVVVTALLLWITWESADRALVAIDENDVTPGFVAIHTWPARILVPLGFLLFALHVAFRLVDDLKALRAGGPDPRDTDPDANPADAPEVLVS